MERLDCDTPASTAPEGALKEPQVRQRAMREQPESEHGKWTRPSSDTKHRRARRFTFQKALNTGANTDEPTPPTRAAPFLCSGFLSWREARNGSHSGTHLLTNTACVYDHDIKARRGTVCNLWIPKTPRLTKTKRTQKNNPPKQIRRNKYPTGIPAAQPQTLKAQPRQHHLSPPQPSCRIESLKP